jgi:cell division transport system permease protein
MGTLLSDTWASLSRNKSMTISLIVTMSVSLMLAALGLLIQAQADRTEQYFGDRLQLQINLCSKNSHGDTCVSGVTTDAQRTDVEGALRANPEVKSFEPLTPREQYRRAEVVYGQSATGRKLLETLSPEAFPVSYYVTLKDPHKFDGVMSQVSGMDGVSSVTSLRELLGPLFTMLDKLQIAALGTSLLLIVAAILQVSNTIRMTAYARRREIGIMRLVGASSWHIQMPFVLESLLAAVISAALAVIGLAVFMSFVVYGYLRTELGTLTAWVQWTDAMQVGAYTTVLSVVLALIPTLVMTRKYLDV